MDTELTPQQMKLLVAIGPEQLEFLAAYSQAYVTGRWWLCVGYRAVAAIGVMAGAVWAIVSVYHMIRP